jgi:hypothetical protein
LRFKLARIPLGVPAAGGFWQSLNGIQFAVVLCGGNVSSAMLAGYAVVSHSIHHNLLNPFVNTQSSGSVLIPFAIRIIKKLYAGSLHLPHITAGLS